MPPTKPPYPPEFRREAVELVRTSGRSVRQVATDLGCSDQALRTWIKQAEIEQGMREGTTSEEREELRQLRREIRVLKQEREILKKATALFAQDSETR